MEQFERIRRDHREEGLSIRALARRHGVHRRAVRQALASAVPPPRRVPPRAAPADRPPCRHDPRAGSTEDQRGAPQAAPHGAPDLGAPRRRGGRRRRPSRRVRRYVRELPPGARISTTSTSPSSPTTARARRPRSTSAWPTSSSPASARRWRSSSCASPTRASRSTSPSGPRARRRSSRATSSPSRGSAGCPPGSATTTPGRSSRGSCGDATGSRPSGSSRCAPTTASTRFFCEPGRAGCPREGRHRGRGRPAAPPLLRARCRGCASLAELNADLEAADRARPGAPHRGRALDGRRRTARPTGRPCGRCRWSPSTSRGSTPVRVDTKARVCVRQSFYSVPARYAGRQPQRPDRRDPIEVPDGGTVVAAHERSLTRGSQTLVLDHYLEILARKPGAMPGRPRHPRRRARSRRAHGGPRGVLDAGTPQVRRRRRHAGAHRGAAAPPAAAVHRGPRRARGREQRRARPIRPSSPSRPAGSPRAAGRPARRSTAAAHLRRFDRRRPGAHRLRRPARGDGPMRGLTEEAAAVAIDVATRVLHLPDRPGLRPTSSPPRPSGTGSPTARTSPSCSPPRSTTARAGAGSGASPRRASRATKRLAEFDLGATPSIAPATLAALAAGRLDQRRRAGRPPRRQRDRQDAPADRARHRRLRARASGSAT